MSNVLGGLWIELQNVIRDGYHVHIAFQSQLR